MGDSQRINNPRPLYGLSIDRKSLQESFNAIREAKPKKLYVAVDAPRVNRKDDEENQAKVIQIVKNVDWDCNVKYLIHEKNLGCSRAGIAAWNWLFRKKTE